MICVYESRTLIVVQREESEERTIIRTDKKSQQEWHAPHEEVADQVPVHSSHEGRHHLCGEGGDRRWFLTGRRGGSQRCVECNLDYSLLVENLQ